MENLDHDPKATVGALYFFLNLKQLQSFHKMQDEQPNIDQD